MNDIDKFASKLIHGDKVIDKNYLEKNGGLTLSSSALSCVDDWAKTRRGGHGYRGARGYSFVTRQDCIATWGKPTFITNGRNRWSHWIVWLDEEYALHTQISIAGGGPTSVIYTGENYFRFKLSPAAELKLVAELDRLADVMEVRENALRAAGKPV